MQSKPLFELRDVSYTYQALKSPPFTALRNVSLSINHGEFVAIIGASGSGKSTLMHLLGLMSDPSTGSLAVAGARVSDLNSDAKSESRNKTIGFLFQQFFLLPQMTVLENVLLPSEYCRNEMPAEQRQERALKLIEQFGLSDQKNKRPSQLSGGQRQRVALCRALLMDPDVLMCDEPTGALDSDTAEEVLNTLVDLNKQGRTIVVITHDQEVAQRAKRIIRIADGRIVADENRSDTHQRRDDESLGHLKSGNLNHREKRNVFHRASAIVLRYAKHLFLPTLQSLVTHRLRTALTMTGLLLGVASVFIMLTLTGRVNKVFKEFFETQGSRKAFVSFDWRQAERTGAPQWRGLHAIQDLPKLNEQISKFGRIDAALDAGGCNIVSARGHFQGTLTGINSLLEAEENGLRVSAGRMPMPNEFTGSPPLRVALLGSDAASKLFPSTTGSDSILGETIVIRGCTFEGILKIVGVLASQDSLFDRDINSSVYLPSTTLLAGGVSPYNRRVVTVPKADVSPTWFAQYVVNKLKIMTSDRFPFRYFAAEQELEKFNLMMGILTGLTLVIGGLCTLIGGIGVMNIMLVNVHERIQEIGIRKAVGARERDIRGQFLLESIGLCLMSGILGILIGIGVSAAALHIAKSALPKVISLTFGLDIVALSAALTVSLGAGLVFGTWPARRAAELEIVDALRQE